jgi:hypothetical protein
VALFVLLCARIAAPRARNDLPQDVRFVIGTGILLVSAALLAIAGQPVLAAVFGIAILANLAIWAATGRSSRLA